MGIGGGILAPWGAFPLAFPPMDMGCTLRRNPWIHYEEVRERGLLKSVYVKILAARWDTINSKFCLWDI